MKGQRRVAIVEDFFEIIKQIHNVDCLHAGCKKTYARVCYNVIDMATALVIVVFLF